VTTLSPVLVLSLAVRALGVPAYGAQILLALPTDHLKDLAAQVFDHAKLVQNTEEAISGALNHLETWFTDGREFVRQNGLICAFSHICQSSVCVVEVEFVHSQMILCRILHMWTTN
jgi:hypothetical protein